ncbi:TRAF transcription factor [Panicum miliaceum]|uniref:TRAF transcription factor n=1 Tax=Panicum miliaceum TaxID=4540 RepID=A0A3L6RME2_PANMI|nr:TRAF transcription factor [Panicum miliaceum]
MATAVDDPRPEAACRPRTCSGTCTSSCGRGRGSGADVTFLVSGQPFAAHKAVLASRSPVFMAALFGGMREGSSRRAEVEVKDKDMEPAAFGALLVFVYTGTEPELDRLGEEEEA